MKWFPLYGGLWSTMPPDPQRSHRMPVIPADVPIIDLTVDEEEEITPVNLLQLVASQPSLVLNTRVSGLPNSNHGLIIDKVFSQRVSASSQRPHGSLSDSASVLNIERPLKRQKLDDLGLASVHLKSNPGYKETTLQSPSRPTNQHHQDEAAKPQFWDSSNFASQLVHEGVDTFRQPNKDASKYLFKSTSRLQEDKSSDEKLRELLTSLAIPRIKSIVQRYDFLKGSSRLAERTALEVLFRSTNLERYRVAVTGGKLSMETWQNLEERAEKIVRHIATKKNVLLRGSRSTRTPSMRPATMNHPPKLAEPTTATSLSPDFGEAGDKDEQQLSATRGRIRRTNANATTTYNLKELSRLARRHPKKPSLKSENASMTPHRKPQTVADSASENGKKALFAAKMSEIMKARWATGFKGRRTTTSTLSDRPADYATMSSSVRSEGRNSEMPQEPVDSRMLESSIQIISSDSSEDNSDAEQMSLSPLPVANHAPTRGYTSSPTTSFSVEGASENSPSKPPKLVHHLRELSSNSDSAGARVLQKIQANYLESQQQIHRQRRKQQRIEVVANQEKDALRHASLDAKVEYPYLDAQSRSDISGGLPQINKGVDPANKLEVQEKILGIQGSVVHVDFCSEEIKYIIGMLNKHGGTFTKSPSPDPREHVETLMLGQQRRIPMFANVIQAQAKLLKVLPNRSHSAISAFLKDAAAGVLTERPVALRLNVRPTVAHSPNALGSVQSILLNREIYGRHRSPQWDASSKARLITSVEDSICKKAEWIDCAGDIAAITWLPGNGFICGTVTHSDEHNQQYNKPGNLMVGSTSTKTLQSLSGHRVTRPIINEGENSRPEMRETQDPWLYTSVTSTAYSSHYDICFTGSFDKTVKIWEVHKDRSSMDLRGTWFHDGHVNFVVTSPEHDMIATAADVREGAIRVYHFKPDNPSESEYSVYSGEKADEQALRQSDTWAYFPATIHWGKSPSVSHLLLVGYSPRSYDPHDEVPELHANTGELCLWNMSNGNRVSINTARTQNVFEVVWHPSQPMFVTATSPVGIFDESVHTQLRIFGQTELGTFAHMKTLDCGALDINEITIMPNSVVECYVTASCTDNSTYVWDSAEGDRPIHVLSHGSSIDDQGEDGDNGVKFAAWGRSADRFYTGSSDGVVKCWNVRAPENAVLVREVATLSGGISAGAFSPDFEKLLLGDSTGKVHLFSLNETEPGEKPPLLIRKVLTPHSEPLPPSSSDQSMESENERTASEIARDFIERNQIIIHQDEYVGAIQGPNYASTGLFARQDHKNCDPEKRIRRKLREVSARRYQYKRQEFSELPQNSSCSNPLQHISNVARELDVSLLEGDNELDLNFVDEHDFKLDLSPSFAHLNIDESDSEDMLSHTELSQLSHCKQQILQELNLQKSLGDLSKD